MATEHNSFHYKKMERVLSQLFVISCLGGLLWQQYQLCEEYFQYKVSRQTRVYTPEVLQDLAMIICVPVYSVIEAKLKSQENESWEYLKRAPGSQKQITFKISELKQFSAHENAILSSIIYWSSYSSMAQRNHNFSELVNSSKFFYDFDICYKYALSAEIMPNVQYISGGTVASFFFNNKLSNASGISLLIGDRNRTPYWELAYSRYIYRGSSSNTFTQSNMFESSHYSISSQLLPPPYETHCHDYTAHNLVNRIECINECRISQAMKQWGRIPSDVMVANMTINYSFLTLNYTSSSKLDNMRLSCDASCSMISCDDKHFVTFKENEVHINDLPTGTSIAWDINIPLIPSVSIASRPVSYLTELILYIMSSVSTWTGLSIISLNPFIIFKRLTSQRKVSDTRKTADEKGRRSRTAVPVSLSDRVSRIEDSIVSMSLVFDKIKQELRN